MTPRNGLWLLLLSAAAASQQQLHSKVGVSSTLRPHTLHAVPSTLKRCPEGSAKSDMVSVMLHINQTVIFCVGAVL